MTLVVIVDTNILVSALITRNDASPVVHILHGMLTARFPFAISETLLQEYRQVLLRPKLSKAHGLSAAEIDGLLLEIVRHAIVLTPVPAPAAPDPGDQHLWGLLQARTSLILVTGDKRLVDHASMRGRVCFADDLLSRLT